MVARSARSDVRMRFHGALNELGQPLASRLSQIDYDREMAFVAEQRLLGVVHLIADPNTERAESPLPCVRTSRGSGRRLPAGPLPASERPRRPHEIERSRRPMRHCIAAAAAAADARRPEGWLPRAAGAQAA